MGPKISARFYREGNRVPNRALKADLTRKALAYLV